MAQENQSPRSLPLEEYALLSDVRTGALVSREGSIDWLCFPRFDSPSVFCALLGSADDGRWKLSVQEAQVTSRRYLPRTFVLETIWDTGNGRFQVLEFLPPSLNQADLIRKVTCLQGSGTVEHDLRIRFNYNRAKPWTRKVTLRHGAGTGLLSVAGPDALLLTGPELHPNQQWEEHQGKGRDTAESQAHGRPDDYQGAVPDRLVGSFELAEGQSLCWALTWHQSHLPAPAPVDPESALETAVDYWQRWSENLQIPGSHSELAMRSLLVLRALTNQATGGIVAAPTTSLPEEFGGQRNWDYRFTWLRDASLTIETLIAHDFTEGALHWRNWLLRAVAGDPEDLQIMYGIAGERILTEMELENLGGYEQSTPVRIGNGAYDQYQADVVGEVMLALAALRDAGQEEDEFSWALQRNLLEFLERNMQRKGHGIWEMRGKPQFFTHGRAMMFAAFNEGVRAVQEHGLEGPVERWRQLREQLREEIMEHGFNKKLNCFTQTYETTEVDASLLQLPATKLVTADDPQMLGTVAKIEQDLLDDQGLVRRYRTESGMDGLPGNEYSFLMCSFWLVEQHARSGRGPEAQQFLDRLAGYATDLGLYAEEYDSNSRRLAGNFPQAFSHLGFLRAKDAVDDWLRQQAD